MHFVYVPFYMFSAVMTDIPYSTAVVEASSVKSFGALQALCGENGWGYLSRKLVSLPIQLKNQDMYGHC
jgi:hypothetical protein